MSEKLSADFMIDNDIPALKIADTAGKETFRKIA